MYQIYMPNCCENDGIKKCETEKWTELRSMRKMAQFDFVIKHLHYKKICDRIQ